MRMRDLITLVEMPVNVQLLGGDQEGSFRKDDIALATNPKAREKVARVWHTSVADVDLYLINNSEGEWDDERRNHALSDALNQARVARKGELRAWRIRPRPDAITVILTQNEGDNRMPLTGWMIAHRLFHALEEPARKIRDPWHPNQPSKYPGLAKPRNAVREIVPQIQYLARMAFPNGGITRSDLGAIGTTRACRNHKLANSGELIPESFAQYLLSGKVVLRPLPDASQFDPKFGVDAEKLARLNDYIVDSQAVMAREFQKMIDYATGKAFCL